MTKRIRFTPLLCAGTFAAVALTGRAFAADQPLVPQPPIATGVDVRAAAAVDVDRDGDLDLVATGLNAVHWHENTGAGWTQRTIQSVTSLITDVGAADVDGDGDADVISTAFQAASVFWHENTGNGAAWTTHTVVATATGVRSVRAGDVDRDGDLDLVAGFDDHVQWFENTGLFSTWTPHTVMTTSAVPRPDTVLAVDVDGDGDLDVVASGWSATVGYDALLYWAENDAGNGTAWTVRSVGFISLGTGGRVAAADIDGDARLDLVLGCSGTSLYLFRNDLGNGLQWTRRTIPAVQGAGVPSTADLDGDGDQDILGAFRGTSQDRSLWFENLAGDGTAWTARTISTTTDEGPTAVVAADLDRDGDADVVVGSGLDDRLALFRNDSIHRDACFAPPATVVAPSTVFAQPRELAVGDLDADGAPDVVAADPGDLVLRWSRNSGDGSSWTVQTIATDGNRSPAMAIADVDGDGDKDVVSATLAQRVAWYENVGGGNAWTRRTVAAAIQEPLTLGTGDIDGDGDLDVHLAGYESGNLWFANAGQGSAFTPRTIGTGVFAAALADMDRDGDLDCATSPNLFEFYLRWKDNALGNGTTWTTHTVATLFGFAYGLEVADVDRDGDPDLVQGHDDGIFLFANLDGVGQTWSTATVTADRTTRVAVGDLDRDGDLDTLATGAGALCLRWYESAGGASWAPHTLVTETQACWDVVAADLDRDGSLDALVSRPDARKVEWLHNRAGQFAIAGTDVAPPGAQNGLPIPLVRLVVTHHGRPGDGSLELASLGLRLESAPGVALTSAQANALIESLQVYLDANGSGEFEPGVDTLVASLPDLTLTAGSLSVPLPDGDANVRVDLGIPRTFFVVAQLTGNASQQSPNVFRATLLAESAPASTAEDRTYDIPLDLSCPVDVASSFVGPITPVTLTGFTVE